MKIYKSENYIPKGQRIGVYSCMNLGSDTLHSHDFIELVYVTNGKAMQYIDENCYEVGRGDVLFINYGSVHSFDACEDFCYVNICFYPEVVSDSIITHENAPAILALTAFNEMRGDRNGGKISFHGSERSEIESIINLMLAEADGELPYRDKLIESCMNILITKMLRKTELGADGVPRDLWDELRDYIDANPDGELTLSTLAKKSFYNPSYFSRLFKQKFGMSLTEYVGRRRIDLALKLLSEGEESTDKIISRCGFSDRSSFYHSFAKYTGTTPSEYRKNGVVAKEK